MPAIRIPNTVKTGDGRKIAITKVIVPDGDCPDRQRIITRNPARRTEKQPKPVALPVPA